MICYREDRKLTLSKYRKTVKKIWNMVEYEDMKLTSPHKYIKNISINGTILSEHLLNISERL